jgi:hypothetical protein
VLQDVLLSDGQQDITCDAHVQQLQPGQRVLVRSAQPSEAVVFQVCCLTVRCCEAAPVQQCCGDVSCSAHDVAAFFGSSITSTIPAETPLHASLSQQHGMRHAS